MGRTGWESGVVRVGVDFGTTHTLVALADGGNYPILTLPFEYEGEDLSRSLIPSLITCYNQQFFHGPAAARCYEEHRRQGASLVASLKRLLQDWRQGLRINVGGREMEVDRLLVDFLTSIRLATLKALDLEEAEMEAVIAVPANASSSQRFITRDCFQRAGFRVRRILDEPTAVGLQFVHERYKRRDRVEADVIIYDLGGGTFDCTFLCINRGAYDPVLSRGVSRLGGDDFDQALLEMVRAGLDGPLTGEDQTELKIRCREAKEGLSPYSRKILLEAGESVVSVSVKEYQEACAPLIGRTIDLVEKVLDETKGRGRDPDRIVLAGGGSLFGAVPKMLRERFGRAKVHQGLYPFAAVAIGAAIAADSADLDFMDRLHNHFGVLRAGPNDSEYLDVIFPKGQELPPSGQELRAARPPYDPRHNIGRFQYLECDDIDPDSDLPRGETVYWNEIFFPFDPSLDPAGDPAVLRRENINYTEELSAEKIIETYELDEYGCITARISRSGSDDFQRSYNLFRSRTRA